LPCLRCLLAQFRLRLHILVDQLRILSVGGNQPGVPCDIAVRVHLSKPCSAYIGEGPYEEQGWGAIR